MLDTFTEIYNSFLIKIPQYQEIWKEYETLIIFLLLLLILIFLLRNSKNNKKIKQALINIPGMQSNHKLTKRVGEYESKILNLEIISKSLQEHSHLINSELEKNYKIKSIEYNPYQDMGVGGKQSFSTAFLNKKGDGMILTSLYSRERTRVLLKKITAFVSEKELAPEEKNLLAELQK